MNRSEKQSESVSKVSNDKLSHISPEKKEADHREIPPEFARSMLRWPFHNPFECVEFIPLDYHERLKDNLPDEQDNETTLT